MLGLEHCLELPCCTDQLQLETHPRRNYLMDGPEKHKPHQPDAQDKNGCSVLAVMKCHGPSFAGDIRNGHIKK